MRALTASAIAVWSLLFAGRAWTSDPSDGDLWWQRALGEHILRTHAIPRELGVTTYAAPHAPWIAQEWLFSSAFAWCVNHGFALEFRLALAACAAATVALTAQRAAALGAGSIAGWAAVASGIALLESFGVRGQVAAWPLLALFLLLAERAGRSRFWALAVVAVWANVHASVILAPLLAGCLLLDTRTALLERFAFFAGVCLATLCTPFGIDLPLMAVHWSLDPDTAYIVEWRAPSFTDWSVLAGAVLPAIVVLAGVRARQVTWAQRTIAALLLVGMVLHARNVATLAIAIVPYAAVVVAGMAGRRCAERPWSRSDAGLLALAAAGAAIVGVQTARSPQPAYAARGAMDAVRVLPGAQRVYCENFDWCSLLASDPRARVFLDGRLDAYPHAVFADWARVRAAAPGWEGGLARNGTTALLAGSGGVLALAAGRSGRWEPVYSGAGITVFARLRE